MLGLSPVRVCDDCLERVRSQNQLAEDLCSRCGDALGMESARFAAAMGMRECTTCRMTPPAFTRAVAFATYDREVRAMLHALKFGGVQRVAEHVLGEWMAAAMLQLQNEAAADLVVIPVPLFKDRQRERGYNQAELLARSAVRRLRKLQPAWRLDMRTDVLQRVRDTRPLFALRPDQRRRNMVGAFRVSKDKEAAIRDREVLVVDDIMTTGATANQCAKVLLKAGASRIWVATVARARPESVLAVAQDVARWDLGAAVDPSAVQEVRW